MITRDELERLRSQRLKLTPKLELTPNNAQYSKLVHDLAAEREQKIKDGERALKESSEKFNTEITRAFRDKALTRKFNRASKQEMKL